MFLTSVNESIQQYFRSNSTLHNKLSDIRLIRTYFSNIFCHDSYISDSQEQFWNVLYSVYLLNAQSLCKFKLF